MPRVFHAPRADRDLDAIALTIGNENPAAAYRLLHSIDSAMALALAFPEIGEAVEHLGPNVRRLCEGPYLLFYRRVENDIELVRVIHGARDIRHLEE